jgi:hypothetical protein
MHPIKDSIPGVMIICFLIIFLRLVPPVACFSSRTCELGQYMYSGAIITGYSILFEVSSSIAEEDDKCKRSRESSTTVVLLLHKFRCRSHLLMKTCLNSTSMQPPAIKMTYTSPPWELVRDDCCMT